MISIAASDLLAAADEIERGLLVLTAEEREMAGGAPARQGFRMDEPALGAAG